MMATHASVVVMRKQPIRLIATILEEGIRIERYLIQPYIHWSECRVLKEEGFATFRPSAKKKSSYMVISGSVKEWPNLKGGT